MMPGVLSKARFNQLLQFTRKKERVATGAFFVEGWRWLEETSVLPEPPLCVLATADAAATPTQRRLLRRAIERTAEFHEVTEAQLARLTDSVQQPGVAALVRWRACESAGLATVLSQTPSAPALVLACDAIGDPGNAGTMVRTADWFGAAAVLFGIGSVEPTNPKCVRATMGSLFHLPLVGAADLAAALVQLRDAGFVSVGAALDGGDLTTFVWPPRAVLVVGNEAAGIRPELAQKLDHRVRIPAFGRAESLNAAVAAAILIADWRRTAGSSA